jgi:hypothetical protein
LLLRNELQDIAGFGNMGEVDLGLDFVALRPSSTRRLRTCLRFRGSLKVSPNLDGFVLFNGTGVRLLLGDTHQREHIENCLAFDFQFSGQIVNSNLTHPPSIPSACPVKPS